MPDDVADPPGLPRGAAPALLQLGYSEEQLESFGEALPTEELYGPRERAVLRFADEVARHVGASSRTYEAARDHLSEEQVVERSA